MPSIISVRVLQALIGAAYAALAVIAVARAPSLVTLLIAAGVMIVSYLTARTVPDAFVSPDAVLEVCGIGLAVICIRIIADAFGGRQTLEWVAIVLAYCAGNRLRAAGTGPAH